MAHHVGGLEAQHADAFHIFKNAQGVGVLRFEAADVVRHAMVERIVRAYDADAAAARGGDATTP